MGEEIMRYEIFFDELIHERDGSPKAPDALYERALLRDADIRQTEYDINTTAWD